MKTSAKEMRDAFILRLFEAARADRDIVFCSNDYGAPSLDAFRSELPEQFFNMAISEQNMISAAAGMALRGKKVFAYSIASFLTLRCLEQVKIDVCCMHLPVTLVGVGTAYAYSSDGPTHHATEDMAVMRGLAGLSIYSPSDSHAAGLLVDVALRQDGPKYFRFDKGKHPVYAEEPLPAEGFRVLRQGAGPCLVATGTMTPKAMQAAELLAQRGVDCAVVDVIRVKPLSSALGKFLRGRRVLSAEEHSITGGLGSALAELVCDMDLGCRLRRAAIEDDLMYAYGLREAMHQERGLSAAALADRAESLAAD